MKRYRAFVAGATLGSVSVFVKSLQAADFTFPQYHNLPAVSSLHKRLVEMWSAIGTQTRGRWSRRSFAPTTIFRAAIQRR